MKNLDRNTEWTRIVEENHKKYLENEFDADLAVVKAICNEDMSGDNRQEQLKNLYPKTNRPASIALASVMIASGVVLLEVEGIIHNAAVPVTLASLIIAGACTGWSLHKFFCKK